MSILVLLQGDIGQTLLIMIIIVSMFIFAGIGVQKIVKGPVLLIVGSFVGIAFTLCSKRYDATLFESPF